MTPDRCSFDDFVTQNVGSLFRTAYLITSDEGEAEDLVQECLLRVSRQWGRVARMEQPVAYARRILVNLAIRASKRRSRRVAELRGSTVELGQDTISIEEFALRDQLRETLRELPARQRAVLVLRYFCDLSDGEIAQVLGWPVGTVKSTGARSLEQLRQVMRPDPSIRGEMSNE